MRSRPNQEQAVFNFNARHPVGTPVRYWAGARPVDDAGGVEAKTRSEAQLLNGHTAVVWVEGHAACIALSHVKASARP